MKIKSRGLGRRELLVDFNEFKITRQGDEVVLDGNTHAPVTWETTIRITPSDIPSMIRLAVNPKIIGLGFRWVFSLFRRRSHDVNPAERTGMAADTAQAEGLAKAPRIPADLRAQRAARLQAKMATEQTAVSQVGIKPGSPESEEVTDRNA
ncbi:MAG: hypothetical protein M1483_01685 [Actinobacteria bacterium]|nr:hypothetical protein [Actinomycetota bacterium]MCL6104341.1 hypothetical protein [Actinomycetota bacterium]